ncbi:MAG: CBS domain-containing protein [Nitrososphaeria archaeon]
MTSVNDFMTKNVFVVKPNDTLARAKNLMLSKKIGRLVVLDREKIIRIITRQDLARAFLTPKPFSRARPIDQLLILHFMKKRTITIEYNADINEAAKIMLEKDIGGIPVTWGGKLAGIITTHDITKYVSQLPRRELVVKDYMNKNVAFASPFHSVNHVANLLFRNPAHRVVVLDSEGKPVGIISPANLAFIKFSPTKKVSSKRSVEKGGVPTHDKISYVAIATAEDMMSSPVIIVHEDDSVQSAASIMVAKDIGALPVLDRNGHVSGIFSKKEVLAIAAKKR